MYGFIMPSICHKVALQLARGETNIQDIQGLGMMQMYPYLAEPLIAQAHRAGALLSELWYASALRFRIF